MKNFLMTLDVDYIYSDQCREFGMVMYIAACVYDWCYDLLTEEDKIQIPLGVEHRLCRGNVPNTMNGILSTSSTIKMEMGFPPRGQAAMVGHGSEFQLMRDYLAMSIAVYDEMPSWYEFVGGRMYNEYIPVRRTYYSAGLYPQGMSCYAPWRFLADCYGAALIQAATGISPYTEDMAKLGVLYRDGGVWKGKRLLSEACVNAVLNAPYELKPIAEGIAFGKGGMHGQMLMVVPAQGRVVAWHGFVRGGVKEAVQWVAAYRD